MLWQRTARAGRLLRPPTDIARQPPRPRLFAHNAQLLLLAPSATRPQVPFLYSSSRKTIQNVTLSAQINRFLSTERKTRWKQQMRWQLRFHAYFWPAAIMIMLAGAGIHQTYLERKYPTPHEWSFWSRWELRTAMARELEPFSRIDGLIIDWARVGSCYKWLLERLESPDLD